MAVTTPLGIKRACPSCANRFYDLNRRPAHCPKCNHSFDPNVQLRPRRARRAAPPDPRQDQDVLLQHMAKSKVAVLPKPKKDKEKVEMDDFEGGDASVGEELDDIDDIGELEEIEEKDDEEMDDDIALEEEDVGDAKLIDGIDDEGEEEEEDEEEAPAAKRPAKKAPPAKKRGKK